VLPKRRNAYEPGIERRNLCFILNNPTNQHIKELEKPNINDGEPNIPSPSGSALIGAIAPILLDLFEGVPLSTKKYNNPILIIIHVMFSRGSHVICKLFYIFSFSLPRPVRSRTLFSNI
jgi:hypothetical protein